MGQCHGIKCVDSYRKCPPSVEFSEFGIDTGSGTDIHLKKEHTILQTQTHTKMHIMAGTKE